MGMGILSALLLQTDKHDGRWGWLPPNINPAYGTDIDKMYLVIMYVVLAMFILTEGLLLYCCFRYRRREGRKASYSHGNKKAEIIWSVIPALMLFSLAMYQAKPWIKIKEGFPKETDAFTVQVFPKQFEWHFRYPGADRQFGGPDDFSRANDFMIPVNRDVVLKMGSQDVIHSFFLPHARVKQDVLPGRQTRTWFRVDRIPCWNIEQGRVEYLTEQEFNNAKVAIDGVVSPKFAGARPYLWITPALVLDKAAAQQRFGKVLTKPFYYERNAKVTKGRVRVQGKIEELLLDEAKPTHILHAIDIACAELCGQGHGNMRGFLAVGTEDVVTSFLSQWSGAGVDKRWTEIWDVHLKEYNVLK